MSKRKQYKAVFKARVALEVLKGERPSAKRPRCPVGEWCLRNKPSMFCISADHAGRSEGRRSARCPDVSERRGAWRRSLFFDLGLMIATAFGAAFGAAAVGILGLL